MSLKVQLMEDMKAAMRARDSLKLSVIRFLNSDIKNFEIDNGEQDDQGILKIVMKEVTNLFTPTNKRRRLKCYRGPSHCSAAWSANGCDNWPSYETSSRSSRGRPSIQPSQIKVGKLDVILISS